MRARNVLKAEETEFEATLTRALEQQPMVTVPAEFAARVMSSLPAQRPSRRQARMHLQVSRTTALAGVAMLLAAMCWLAPHSTASFRSAAFDMELLLLGELAGVAAWIGMRRDA
jgi:hypothetical protein